MVKNCNKTLFTILFALSMTSARLLLRNCSERKNNLGLPPSLELTLVHVKGDTMSHWTDLFKEHPELFFYALDERVAQARVEVDFLLECLHKHGFKTRSVLDLNCGIRRHSIELGKSGTTVLGTDLSPDYIDTAKKRAENEGVAKIVRFKVAGMRRIALAL